MFAYLTSHAIIKCPFTNLKIYLAAVKIITFHYNQFLVLSSDIVSRFV